MKKTLKYTNPVWVFICSILFGTSFCVQKNVHQNKRNLSSSEDLSGWGGPKIVQTPAGELHVYHKVINSEPTNVTYVNVKYLCKGDSLKHWKRLTVQWFYGVDKTLPESIVPLVYDPVADLSLRNSNPSNANDTKKTVTEEFNLKARCVRDRGY